MKKNYEHRVLSEHLCECGCKRRTYYCDHTVRSLNKIAGKPLKYLAGHSSQKSCRPETKPEFSWCCTCKTEKKIDEFYKRYGLPTPACRQCGLEWNAFAKYGIKRDEYLQLFKDQNNLCAICNKAETRKQHGKQKPLCVDHCHTTGIIRGLLCSRCNIAIGLMRDDIKTLESAIKYINKTRTVSKVLAH